MYKRRFTLTGVLLLGLWFSIGRAQEQYRVAVLDFQNYSGSDELDFLEMAIPEILITDLVQCRQITIVERARLDEILDEMQLALSGVIDEQTAAEIGEMAGATAILIGSVTRGGQVYRIDSRLVDVSSGAVILAEKMEWNSEDAIIAAIDELAEKIIWQIAGQVIEIPWDQPLSEIPHRTQRALSMETFLDKPLYLTGSGEPLYLQVDLYSRTVKQRKRRPLNLALVIDRSGSMAAERKLEYAREAAKFVVDNMGSEDYLSIITYETEVQLVLPSQPVQRKRHLRTLLDHIHSGGSTNLSGGILMGFTQVAENLGTERVNRVLLLSDGLANRGITSPDKLYQICNQKARQGITLSTFGVGADYDEDLMLGLSEYSQGRYYFIDSPERIAGIFSRELSGLLAVAAQNVSLEVQTFGGVAVAEVLNYLSAGTHSLTKVALGDIFSDEHQTIIFRLRMPERIGDTLRVARVVLNYDDVITGGEHVFQSEELVVRGTQQSAAVEDYSNYSVRSRVSMIQSTLNMQKAVQMVDDGQVDAAQNALQKEILEVAESAKNYQSTALKKQLLSIRRYTYEIDDLQEKSEREVRMLQKSAKYQQYQRQKQIEPKEELWSPPLPIKEDSESQSSETRDDVKPVAPKTKYTLPPKPSPDIKKVEPEQKKPAPSADEQRRIQKPRKKSETKTTAPKAREKKKAKPKKKKPLKPAPKPKAVPEKDQPSTKEPERSEKELKTPSRL